MAERLTGLLLCAGLVAMLGGLPGSASAQTASASGCWASPPPAPRVGYVPPGGRPRSSTDLSYLEWLRFFGPPQVRKLFPPEQPGRPYKIGERYVGKTGPYPYWLNNVPVSSVAVSTGSNFPKIGTVAGWSGGSGFNPLKKLAAPLGSPRAADASPRGVPLYLNYILRGEN